MSISTVGVKEISVALKIWKSGVTAMIRRFEPSAILVYGGEIAYYYRVIKMVNYENKVKERMSSQ